MYSHVVMYEIGSMDCFFSRFSLSLVNNDEVKANMIVLLRPNDDVKLHIKLLES